MYEERREREEGWRERERERERGKERERKNFIQIYAQFRSLNPNLVRAGP